MADELFDPEHLEATTFDIVRRGFDPTAVRDHLRLAGEQYHRLRLERDELTGRLAEADAVTTDQLEASQVATALGVEAAHVLEAAHQAAVERAARAEREAEAVREEARAEAETTRGLARSDAEEILADARRIAEELVDDGRTRGRDMVGEAQTVRERILGDLARKRQTGRAQVEQLKAARDRLLESLTTVQGSLDTAIDDLIESVPDARAAAERAGLRVTSEPEITAAELEAEIEAARLVGHPLVDDRPDRPASDSFDTGEMIALTDLDSALDDAGSDPEADPDPDPEPEPEPAPVADATEDGVDEAGPDGRAELYDVESDPDDDLGDLADVGEDDDDLDAVADDVTADGPSGVDVLFAKLRESHTDGDAEAASDDESGAADDEAVADGSPDARLVARADTAASVAKAMKKVLVDEQGTLLDGVRRSGGEAIQALVGDTAAHDVPYDDAARPSLVALAGDLGADAVDLAPALAQIHSIALEPVRQRLREVTEATDDADEISDTVRALYRESRSRRLDEAAAAAVVATDAIAVLATADGPVRWMVEPGGPCGPDCADNELAGEIAPGDAFPTGDLHPPGHAACTCRLVPID